MASDLPKEFDVVVLGTGLPESILAAAFSRNGHTVLHLDRNQYYSSNWASFSVDGIDDWKKKNKEAIPETAAKPSVDINEGEKLISVPQQISGVSNISVDYHVSDSTVKSDTSTEIGKAPPIESGEEGRQSEGSAGVVSPSSEGSESIVEGQFADKSEEVAPKQDETGNAEEKSAPATPEQKIWTSSELKRNSKRFNMDLAPKVLYCSGQMVELLIVSDVAKYCEFRTVSRMLTLLNGQLEKVPCSRADVFGSKKVSMLEKRLLMKFLTFCAEYDKYPDQYQDFVGKPFSEFLKFKKLTTNTHHFVFHSIAMATENTSTEEGLKKTQHFLQSLGRYGNTACLFPLYGSGEIPQGFCRLCAVFGGVYCLQMSATHIVTDEENKCCAILTTEGQRISCKHLVLGPSYCPPELLETAVSSTISRAILVTNRTMLDSDSQELSMLHLLPEDDPSRPITLLELPPSSQVCPQNSFVVHLTRQGSSDPQTDLSPIIQKLFGGEDQTSDQPCVLWSTYFSQTDQSGLKPSACVPGNVYLLPGPGTEVDMDDIVQQAKIIWEKVCPDEEFLPKPPNPEDIIFVDDAETKVGEGGENTFEDKDEENKEDASDEKKGEQKGSGDGEQESGAIKVDEEAKKEEGDAVDEAKVKDTEDVCSKVEEMKMS